MEVWGEGIAVAAFLRTAFEVECTQALISALACSYTLSSSRGALGLAG